MRGSSRLSLGLSFALLSAQAVAAPRPEYVGTSEPFAS